jgi:hypothetical protein
MTLTIVRQIGPVDGAIKDQGSTGSLEPLEMLSIGRRHGGLFSVAFSRDELRETLRRKRADDIVSAKELLLSVWSFDA